MAAPSNAYITEKLHDGNNVASSIKADIAIANPPDVPTLKARFYLDFLLSTGKDGDYGFVGGCTIGSDNYYMHAEARRWTGRGRGPAGQMIQWFNDAGLNTLGRAGALPNVTQHRVSGFIIPSFSTTSAYYVNGQYGVQINPNATGWVKVMIGNLIQGQTLSTAATDIIEDILYDAQVGDVIQLRAYHENAEGLYINSTVRTVTLGRGIITMRYDDGWASWAATGVSTLLYYSRRGIWLGDLKLTDDGFTNAATGYYVDSEAGKWYHYDGTSVMTQGDAVDGYWPVGDPGNSDEITFQAFSTVSNAQVCTIGGTPVTTYQSKLDDRYYTNRNLTNFVANGYYRQGPPNTGAWFQITNGVAVANGTCIEPE